MKRLSALALTLFLLLPQIALASSADGAEEEKFNPEHDFDPASGSRSTSVRSTSRSTRRSPT